MAAGGHLEALGGLGVGVVRVQQAELEGVDARLLGELVHVRLEGEGQLRRAVAAHGLRVGVVRVDAGGLEAHVRHLVEAGRRHHHDRGRGRAPRGIGAIVKNEADVAEGQLALGVAALADLGPDRLPGRGGEELLFPVEEDLHRPPRAVGQQDGDVLEGVGVQLRAEAAPDGGVDHPHLAAHPHGLERFLEVGLGHARDLGDGVDGEVLARVEGGHAAGGAHAAVGHPARLEVALHDVGGRRFPRLDVAGGELPRQTQAVVGDGLALGVLVVDERRALGEGLLGVEDRGQVLVLHLDELEGFLGDLRCGGRDRRHLVAIGAHAVLLQGHVVFEQAEADLGRVVGGQHRLDSGERVGFRGVDGEDLRVGPGGVEDLPEQHPRKGEVVDELRPTDDLLAGVGLGDGLAYDGEHLLGLLLVGEHGAGGGAGHGGGGGRGRHAVTSSTLAAPRRPAASLTASVFSSSAAAWTASTIWL